jgi:hypothetical protein
MDFIRDNGPDYVRDNCDNYKERSDELLDEMLGLMADW